LYLLLQLAQRLLRDVPQRLADHGHQGQLPVVQRPRILVQVQQVQLVLRLNTYVLEKHASVPVVEHLRVLVQSVAAEVYELPCVVEQNARRRLLVVTFVARVEHFDPVLAIGLRLFRRNAES